MLDEILEIFERDREQEHSRRSSLRGFFDRFNEDDDDERARRSHSYPDDRYDYDRDDDWYGDDHRTRH